MMKPGDSWDCPKCGRNTFLKKTSVMDGWTKKGDILSCASCGEKVADLAESPAAGEREKAAAQKLSGLFGGETVAKVTIDSDASEKSFCKDCALLVPHPFLLRCSKHNKEVNPMDDCPDFVRKQDKDKK